MAQREPSARLFFGLPVDGELADALAVLATSLALHTEGRAVRPSNFHATVVFLGSVPRTRVSALRLVGDEVPGTGCAVQLDRVGSFRGARVAWIGTTALPASLHRLQQRLVERLAVAGWTLDARPFSLHVTLVRHCRSALKPDSLPALPWHVDRLVLYESIGTPDGPRYEPLVAWPLSRDDPA